MNKVINFDPDFAEISFYKMLDAVPNYSQGTIYQTLSVSKLQTLIKKHFGELTVRTKTQYTVFNDAPDKISAFYLYVTATSEDICFMYSMEDFSEETEEDDIPVYDPEIHGEIAEIDDVKVIKDEHQVNSDVCSDVSIYYNEKTKDKFDAFMKDIDECIHTDEEKNIFYTIGVNSYGFNLLKQETKVDELEVALNYGEDFVPVYDDILNNLNTKYHGLILLHGEPGTGKTTMIRHIIAAMCNKKKIIYIPAYMIEQLANPEFITFIQKHKESVLILEDAEFALQSRQEEYGAQAVSNLLNITNGLLNDAVKIQVIATFNMDKSSIDPALLRAGRLLNDWKFDKLSIEECQALADHIGKDLTVDKPMTIAEIYAEPTLVQDKKKTKKKRIGF